MRRLERAPERAEESLSSHLRTFVLGRVRAGSRVALLGQDEALSRALAAVGCVLLEGEGARARAELPGEALRRFSPTHVLFPGEVEEERLAAALRDIAGAAPGAEVLLGFHNAGATATWLATVLEGTPPRWRLTAQAFSRCIEACGFQVAHREGRSIEAQRLPLARGTERALRALLERLAPSAQEDVLLYALAPSPEGARPEPATLERELLSVIVWAGPECRPLLDEALFSLACQAYRPLELIVVEPPAPAGGSPEVESLLERYRRLEPFSFQRVRGSAGGAMDEAIRRARGQYLAFLEGTGVVYPSHYVRLIEALRAGEAAWAVARAFRCIPSDAPSATPYILHKRPFPLGDELELEHLRRHPWLLHALVIDRHRIGALRLHVPDPTSGQGVMLPLELAALFEPVFTAGLASCEQRMPGPGPERLEGLEELQVLRSLGALERAIARAREAGANTKDLRHRMLDELNERFKHRAPWLHGALRGAAAKLLR